MKQSEHMKWLGKVKIVKKIVMGTGLVIWMCRYPRDTSKICAKSLYLQSIIGVYGT